MAHFDERSGIVECLTDWGRWWQTLDEVYVEVTNLPEGVKGKDIKCEIKPSSIKVTVQGKPLIQGTFPGKVHADDSIWTLEDRKLLRICLPKSSIDASNCWKSLLEGQFETNPLEFENMQKKMTLQRFQLENPGMDFSQASISGNYQGGGPTMES